MVTEFSPDHHKHQTGLYWGFTRVNGRDYFHNPQGDYWRRVSATVTQASGDEVRWQTVYDLLDEAKNAVLTETERWSMREENGRFLLDLEWRGEAKTDVTDRQVRLRRPVPAHAVARGHAGRGRQRRAAAQRARRGPARDVDRRRRCRSRAATIWRTSRSSTTPTTPAIPRPGGSTASSASARPEPALADWTIKKGETEVVRHRFVVYTGTLNDVELTKAWGEYTRQPVDLLHGSAVGHRAAGRPRRNVPHARSGASAMTMVPGYAVKAWAGEPMIQQPMAFCWDDRGRLWVAENLDYETRGRGFSNSGNSRILILEDTDRDGVADSRKVFMEGIVFPSALAVGFDGVYIGAPPNLLFVPDRDGDDKADTADIEVRLTGWGIRDRHEVLNSLHWGPDGWLYGLQGFATPSKIRKPAGKGRLYKAGEPFPEDILSGRGRSTSTAASGATIRPRIASRSWRTASATRGASTTTPRVSSS